MQRKLATWTSEDKQRRIDRLFRLIANSEWLKEVARITLRSAGATTPGIDGITRDSLKERVSEFTNEIRRELLEGSYEPQPVRRIFIRKSNGKQRPLGIPTIKDRIVQRAMLMAMDPIWETDFHRLSYGFRPERNVHQAIRTVKIQLQDTGEHTRGR